MTTKRNIAQLITDANRQVIQDIRTGSKLTCDDLKTGATQFLQLSLYKPSTGSKRNSLSIATVANTDFFDKAEIPNYVTTDKLTDESLILFKITLHSIATVSGLTGRLGQANNSQQRLKVDYILAVDATNVYVLADINTPANETNDITRWGVTIGNKWLGLQINTMLSKGRKVTWKATKTVENDITTYGLVKS